MRIAKNWSKVIERGEGCKNSGRHLVRGVAITVENQKGESKKSLPDKLTISSEIELQKQEEHAKEGYVQDGFGCDFVCGETSGVDRPADSQVGPRYDGRYRLRGKSGPPRSGSAGIAPPAQASIESRASV